MILELYEAEFRIDYNTSDHCFYIYDKDGKFIVSEHIKTTLCQYFYPEGEK
jgi:hypothetical protein